MKVYKFGGASVRDAEGVRNVTSIVKGAETPLVVVISAMGKMTNAFEELVSAYFREEKEVMDECLKFVHDYHTQIIHDLFGNANASKRYNEQMHHLETRLKLSPSMHFDFEYDQIVSFGELLSTSIVADFWEQDGVKSSWTDVRTILKTDDLYRDSNVDWSLTNQLMMQAFNFADAEVYLTQGFLGGTISNLTTTLGREGSDYTAAIIGHVMNASDVTIWKDVPGVLNADPRWYQGAVKIEELSYMEAIELSYYGAQVIHPKTLKPLQNKNIPLKVRSFIDKEEKGTVILERTGISEQVPVFILKTNQIFVTISPLDFSFIMEDKLIEIISIFKKFRVKMNLMQNSALNFSASFDRIREMDVLLSELKNNFSVRYNENVQLITIRQYTNAAIEEMTSGKEILDSQITRKVARFVIRG
ncbi:aspartate kinase [Alkalitalea saponilacus]|uniref:Aspartokinase n=1 Tax=Alkalitalea saponilacus TaxID=889453 RepID=A0A1T5HRD0_9BACT|nr:aspartate kinase [Alkalitalea saponilacus]ASB48381.1 aspartate kinase [Alkalitalea saponilacus]SKC23167.1 aspartate kinase [Alkalitalea saponilacus]